jgi:four helix bundle protein
MLRQSECRMEFTPIMPSVSSIDNRQFATSISANVHESEFAQSPSDFTSKLHIALKEANETMNWLNLLHDVDHLSDQAFESMAADCNELIALLVSSIKTIKNNNK